VATTITRQLTFAEFEQLPNPTGDGLSCTMENLSKCRSREFRRLKLQTLQNCQCKFLMGWEYSTEAATEEKFWILMRPRQITAGAAVRTSCLRHWNSSAARLRTTQLERSSGAKSQMHKRSQARLSLRSRYGENVFGPEHLTHASLKSQSNCEL